MCGLLIANANIHSELRVRRGLQAMQYRGDSRLLDVTTHGGWHLGHVRLPLGTEEENGKQPFWAEDRAILFVGEIFDVPKVQASGSEHQVSPSEEESIVQALRTPNLVGFHELDGFWALAMVDKYGNLHALTDHIGTKPLYYWPEAGILCSEIFPMFQLAPPPALDEVYLSNVLKWGYDPTGRTPFQGITQVAPGTVLFISTLAPSESSQKVYWDWNAVPLLGNDLTKTIDSAILNYASQVNQEAAVLVSGGLDSTIIYYTLKHYGLDWTAYSVENGESEFLPPDTILLDDPGIIPVPIALEAMQTPIDLGSLFPQIQLAAALAKEGIRIALSGDGADELFGGYRRAEEYNSQYSDLFCELPYYHLPRLDRVMMRGTIELRAPFLSPKVIRAVLAEPKYWGNKKQALKDAYRGRIPSKVLEREKKPLKSPAVLEDALTHRKKLIEAYREQF